MLPGDAAAAAVQSGDGAGVRLQQQLLQLIQGLRRVQDKAEGEASSNLAGEPVVGDPSAAQEVLADGLTEQLHRFAVALCAAVPCSRCP